MAGPAPTYTPVVQEHEHQSCTTRERKNYISPGTRQKVAQQQNGLKVKNNTYCPYVSITRLFRGSDGLNRSYKGISETPGQLFSSGDPQSSQIFFNWSIWKRRNSFELNAFSGNTIDTQKKVISLTSVFPGKIGSPFKSSANKQATDQMSTAGPYSVAPSSNSGALPGKYYVKQIQVEETITDACTSRRDNSRHNIPIPQSGDLVCQSSSKVK